VPSRSQATICVGGPTRAKSDGAIGKTVIINGDDFHGVGTPQPTGYSGTHDQDNLVILPIIPFWKELKPNQSQQVDRVLIRSATPQRRSRRANGLTSNGIARQVVKRIAFPPVPPLSVPTMASAPDTPTPLPYKEFVVDVGSLRAAEGVSGQCDAPCTKRNAEP
jgi:hypothetical protein